MARQSSFYDYEGFVEKFEPKKTTDDCYTPPEVYEVVAGYVERRWGVARADMVRPFYPGGDYEDFRYPSGAVVVDNPPFSILSSIKSFYCERGVPFFLFAPSLAALSSRKHVMRLTHIICDAEIVYENGAVVRTAFVTNLPSENVVETAPALRSALDGVRAKLAKREKKELPKYEYPDAVLTAARCQYLAGKGVEFAVRKTDAAYIAKMDAQIPYGKSIFGGGLLLSERAAAERAAAERAAAERAAAERAAADKLKEKVWKLSERERLMQRMLG